MDSFKDVLEAAQMYCKAQMAEPTYNLYIDGLEPISFEDSSHITLSVRNDFICKIVTDRYLGLLKEAFKSVLGFDVDITLVVPSTPPHEVVLAQQYEANPASPQGNYEFTFENFIKGPSNQFAFAAAQAVAANPSGAYNPLFIYGGSGLGKTHLLTAIQTEIKRTHPDFVIMYVTCEQFTNELIAAIRAGSTEDFRMKYRVADLLLVDDIQFIAGKESTQEEFFHTFNSLHDAHKMCIRDRGGASGRLALSGRPACANSFATTLLSCQLFSLGVMPRATKIRSCLLYTSGQRRPADPAGCR